MCNSYPKFAPALLLSASLCALPSMSAFGVEAVAAIKKGSSTVEKIAGSDLKRVILTQKAAERLDIKTGKMAADAAGVMTFRKAGAPRSLTSRPVPPHRAVRAPA